MRKSWRREVCGLALLVAACAMLASAMLAAAGSAAAQRKAPTLEPSGSLIVSWRGEAARNCQAAGACGVSGSLEVIPEQEQGSESPPASDVQVDDADSAARVAVQGVGGAQGVAGAQGVGGAPARVCTDRVPVSIRLLVKRRAGGARHAVTEDQAAPSSGRCAGPAASDLARIELPARRLPGHREAYDLTGTTTFGAAPTRSPSPRLSGRGDPPRSPG